MGAWLIINLINNCDRIIIECRWTRSNWAFLNEPPVIAGEVPKYKYAAQYHVATLASSDSDTRIISTT